MYIDNVSYNLLDAVSVGICIIDKDFHVLFWNEYLEEYTGIKKEDIHNKLLGDFSPSFEKEIYRERIQSVFEGWPPVILSSQLHQPFFVSLEDEQKKRFQEVTISPISFPLSEELFAVLTITDVTDLTNKLKEQNELYKKANNELEYRRITQEKLRISENSLRDLNATKDKFFSIIAHDLRGPITSLIHLSDILVKNLMENNSADAKKISQYINKSSRSLHSLLINLLDWSRLQLGKIVFKTEFIDINELIDIILSLYESAANAKEITIVKDLQSGLTLFADINMFSTIVRNLLSNAVKYTPVGGKITIKAFIRDEDLIVSVIDTGVGLEKEDIQRLFKIDSNFSMPGTSNETGTGLGLILSKEFVENHGGKIWVSSNFGEGSNFSFSIPIKLQNDTGNHN